jgi:hypothetical protein
MYAQQMPLKFIVLHRVSKVAEFALEVLLRRAEFTLTRAATGSGIVEEESEVDENSAHIAGAVGAPARTTRLSTFADSANASANDPTTGGGSRPCEGSATASPC